MKQKSFKTQKNGNLDFTHLGFGGVPIGNLYRELTDEEGLMRKDGPVPDTSNM